MTPTLYLLGPRGSFRRGLSFETPIKSSALQAKGSLRGCHSRGVRLRTFQNGKDILVMDEAFEGAAGGGFLTCRKDAIPRIR